MMGKDVGVRIGTILERKMRTMMGAMIGTMMGTMMGVTETRGTRHRAHPWQRTGSRAVRLLPAALVALGLAGIAGAPAYADEPAPATAPAPAPAATPPAAATPAPAPDRTGAYQSTPTAFSVPGYTKPDPNKATTKELAIAVDAVAQSSSHGIYSINFDRGRRRHLGGAVLRSRQDR